MQEAQPRGTLVEWRVAVAVNSTPWTLVRYEINIRSVNANRRQSYGRPVIAWWRNA